MAQAPSEAYPFATTDGKAIPLDIIKPKGFIYSSFPGSITIPANTSGVSFFYATESCVLAPSFSPALTEDTYYSGALFVPKGHAVISTLLEGTFQIEAIDNPGFLFVQEIEKWAGLSLDIQYVRR